MDRRFQLVDVFHHGAFSGNPLAVVFDAEDLSTAQMQRMTQWFHLSETAFLLKPTSPQADYRVRIFTTGRELQFAGHPTLGSCQAWLSTGGQPHQGDMVIQECGAGLVPIKRTEQILAFAAPPLIRSGDVEEADLQAAADFLRIEHSAIIAAQWADNGPGWLAVLLDSAEAVLALNPSMATSRPLDLGVVGPYTPDEPAAFELRAFSGDHISGMIEDPVTGSLNASVAQWLLASGRATAPYIASQGTRLGCTGRVFIDQDTENQVWVGGKVAIRVSGVCSF